MANGDDIEWLNKTMPDWPEGVSLFGKILCLLGYHKEETRVAPRRFNAHLGREIGPTKLRNQCNRCKMGM